jgi:hypothetical protein
MMKPAGLLEAPDLKMQLKELAKELVEKAVDSFVHPEQKGVAAAVNCQC